ncbi:P antigen family member 3-like isoform X2 [Talpa occidentalis]|uniref:P antigen family member 3-like isoform X2 n=1 Tax=Talpa occidentalis TaxID=50954 RepID=UPI0018907705|nr:P antigen family member 3-like isoform X2 [Talpa occidentalis]
MSGHVRTRSKSEGSQDDREPSRPLGPLVLIDKQLQGKGSPTESQDITPDQEKKDERVAVVQDEGKGPNPKSDLQELPQPKTGAEGRDDLQVKEKILPNLEPATMPEAGEGQPQV